MKEIYYYTTLDGKCPFVEWFEDLAPLYQSKILTRLDRVIEGNMGDWKPLQNSKLSELRFRFGSGYRIYFKEIDNIIILLIAGSDKSDQKKVIKKANEYFEEYLNRNK